MGFDEEIDIMKGKRVFRRLRLSGIIAAVIAFAVIAPLDAHAAGTIAEVKINSQYVTTTYSSFSRLKADMDYWEGRNIVIDMTDDWDNDGISGRGKFDERLVIPEDSKVTLNMNGHVFDRALNRSNDWESNGELICMESGSSLTINGGDKTTPNLGWVHTSTDADKYADQQEIFYGGLLTGGSSTNGAGGIHVKSNCTLILNNVTLAGCRSEVPWHDSAATNSGYGGGIWIAGGNSTVKLKNSTITGNHAQEDGGGIFASNHNNVRIELEKSKVDKNYSRSDGGGIDVDGEEIVIKGDGKSSVSSNKTNGRGGGIYLWNDEVTVSGLSIFGNSAAEGGGVYTLETEIGLQDLNITGNSATTGGGIYVANEKTSITDCNITGNRSGYGVFVKRDIKDGFTLGGSTVIKDNPSKGGKDNLVIENFNASWITFALQRGADIGVRYVSSNHNEYCYLSRGKCADYRQYLTCDDPGYYITYSYDDNNVRGRYLAFVKKGITIPGAEPQVVKPEKKELTASQAKPEVVGKVGAGGGAGDKYALIRGFLHHEKTSNNDDTDNIFYYTDGFFYSDPYTYNDHLATASWNLALGGTYLREGIAKLDSYKYKHTGTRQFFSDIGCPDENIYVNDCNVNKPGTDTIGVTIGSKELQQYGNDGKLESTGDILIPIAVRGGGYEAEWASNVLLGSGSTRGGEAQGFSEAADQVMQAVEYYIAKYDLEDELAAGKVKFWVSGFSRAGATANITSKRLIEKYASGAADKNNQVFGYPCEAAKGGTDKAEKLSDKTKYYSIHNLINAGDMVPLVGPEEMGFKRYGVDHYIPGTAAMNKELIKGNTKRVEPKGNAGIETVTTYVDNSRLNSKFNSDYANRRSRMLKHLAAIDSSLAFDDYFYSRGLDIVNLNFGGQTGAYAGSNREDFIIDFFAFLQKDSNNILSNRSAWATKELVLDGTKYGTVQQAARDTMALLFSMEEDSKTSVMERVSNISDALHWLTFSSDVSIRDLFDDVLGDWHTLSDEKKLKYIHYFWDIVEDSGALDFLPEGEAAKLENNWPALANLIFSMTDADWDTYPGKDNYTFPSGQEHAWASDTDDYMMYLTTLAFHLGSTLNNHAPELNMAWTRTYDSYYDNGNGPTTDASKEYIIKWGSEDYSVDAPKAYVETGRDDEPQKNLKRGETANELIGDQRIHLDCTDIKGEAVYYTLKEVGGSLIEDEQIYRGGIDLVLGVDDSKTYELTTYARHYGVNSDSVTYKIKLDRKTHIVNLIVPGGSPISYNYAEGEQVTITAKSVTGKTFAGWKSVTDGVKTPVAETLFTDWSSACKNQSLTFIMPKTGSGSAWAEDYSLRLTPGYGDRVTNLTISGLSQPVADQPLGSDAVVSFGSGQESDPGAVTLPVAWSYQDGNSTVIGSGNAFGKTVYTATINVPKIEGSREFAMVERLTASLSESDKRVNITRNNADGSVTLKITFDATGEGTARPGTPITLKVHAYDLSGNDLGECESYHLQSGGRALLISPDIQDEVFNSWETTSEAGRISIAAEDKNKRVSTVEVPSVGTTHTTLTINARYAPVITAVSASLAAPEIGKTLPTTADLNVTISNTFEVDPNNVQVTWAPDSGKAKALTAYTATVKLVPDGTNNINIRPAGSEPTVAYTTYSIDGVLFSDNITVKLNGSDADVVYNTNDRSLSYTFDPIKYNLRAVKPVEGIAPLPNGSDAEAIKEKLPKTTKIVTDDGTELTVPITWDTPAKAGDGSGNPLDSTTWTVKGEIQLDDQLIENSNNVDLKVSLKVTVEEAPTASSPRASGASGTNSGKKSITPGTATKRRGN